MSFNTMPTPTPREEWTEGWCCTDCIMLLANGETPPELDEDETAAWLAEIDSLTGDGYWTTGGDHEEGCTALDDGEDCYCEREEFSRRPCAVCGSNLGGSRHLVTYWWTPSPS